MRVLGEDKETTLFMNEFSAQVGILLVLNGIGCASKILTELRDVDNVAIFIFENKLVMKSGGLSEYENEFSRLRIILAYIEPNPFGFNNSYFLTGYLEGEIPDIPNGYITELGLTPLNSKLVFRKFIGNEINCNTNYIHGLAAELCGEIDKYLNNRKGT